MMSPMRHRLLATLAVPLLFSLACANWLYPNADMQGVAREVAVDAGYTVPVEANDVYVRDRGTQDVRTSWFRYTLPGEAFDELRVELEADPGVHYVGAWVKPDDWPDFTTASIETPDWWAPSGDAYVRELPFDPELQPIPAGRMWALEGGTVHVWMWQWEGWQFQGGAPASNVGDEAPEDGEGNTEEASP